MILNSGINKGWTPKKGKMRQGYLWPVHGEQDEIVFSYTPIRDHGHVKAIIGDEYSGTLLTDGYEAYARYAQTRDDVTHAQCWSHTRRYFDRAKEAEPESVEAALALIGLLYQHEKEIRKKSPASKVIELTPRVWKEKFADNPLRSDLNG